MSAHAPLSAVEIAQVADEIARTLRGQNVQRVVQPDPETVILDVRGRGLLLAASQQHGRLHLLAAKPGGTGEAPPHFCMLLRKHLEGARLQRVTPVPGERAIELGFARADGEALLRLFLYGKAAQLQLVVEGRVLGHIGPARRVYEALPPPRTIDPAATSRFPEPPSPAIEQRFSVELAATQDEVAQQAALVTLRADEKRLLRLHAALVKDLDRMTEVPRLRKEADLLLALAADRPAGAATILLADLMGDGEPIEIVLDPARSAVDNAQQRYKQCRRLERGQRALAARIAVVAADLDKARARRLAVEGGDLGAAPMQPRIAPRADKSKGGKLVRLPYREYRSARGAPILVGRGAAKNDELTFKVARGNDWWMHTLDAAGAHVVVALDGRPLDEETLLDAATLAAHFSSLRDEAQVDVSYTQRKGVKKPPRSKPGLVSVAGAKTIRVRMQPDRLARLLSTLVE